ncbi:MAG TPA: prenyltransferase/squalene oxidase repeat-containing protein [Terriglobia bacterium]|nr:prenyltransferase/squalene oxidase repeat-containing protein [Terriglobia bacterium]
MKSIVIGTSIALLIVGALWAQNIHKAERVSTQVPSMAAAVDKGAKWLASVQGADGGWGQDGGETSYVRTSERLESNGNDVANTAVAALALLEAGKQYQPNVDRAIDFILRKVETSPADGLAITDAQGTQIERKLGPYIDTFLTSMLLAKVDGTRSNTQRNVRVRQALQKCVAKIVRNQKGDGSWNVAGGWAPVLGTSMASRSLFEAQQKGVKVDETVMARAETYTMKAINGQTQGAAGVVSGVLGGAPAAPSEAAGVPLYQSAQALEQLSRTEKDRKKNAPEIAALSAQLADARFVNGFGSIGGEEFFSYLNISDGLRRAGGDEWNKWHSQITQKILNLQNSDGTWAGHHCITGRVAVTSAAILNLSINRAD